MNAETMNMQAIEELNYALRIAERKNEILEEEKVELNKRITNLWNEGERLMRSRRIVIGWHKEKCEEIVELKDDLRVTYEIIDSLKSEIGE